MESIHDGASLFISKDNRRKELKNFEMDLENLYIYVNEISINRYKFSRDSKDKVFNNNIMVKENLPEYFADFLIKNTSDANLKTIGLLIKNNWLDALKQLKILLDDESVIEEDKVILKSKFEHVFDSILNLYSDFCLLQK